MDSIEIYLQQLVQNNDNLVELSRFLDNGGDPNQKVYGSNTLLHVAAQNYEENDRAMQKLISAGADVELTTSVGHTPLQFAVMSRNYAGFLELIEVGACITTKNNYGRTALHYAVDPCHPRRTTQRLACLRVPDVFMVRMLLENDNIDVNPVDIKGDTPLMWAVRQGCSYTVTILLKSGSNPNISNKKGKNTLHAALSLRTPDCYIITELLLNGANIYEADNFRNTPIDILLQKCRNRFTFDFVKDCLRLIAFKYRVSKDLDRKVRRIPELLDYLKKACHEVESMNKQIV